MLRHLPRFYPERRGPLRRSGLSIYAGRTAEELKLRLRETHAELHKAMSALNTKKENYSEVDLALRVASGLILDLIEDAGGYVVRPD